MTEAVDYEAALAGLYATLSADDYHLTVSSTDGEPLRLAIVAGPDACAECLVPKSMMRQLVEQAIRAAGVEPPALDLVYPGEGGPAAQG